MQCKSRDTPCYVIDAHFGSFSRTEFLSDPTYDNVLLNSVNALSVAAPEPLPENLTHIPDTHLEVGSMIEVTTDVLDVIFGVIRWIGQPEGHRQPLVGVELERELFDSPLDATDGMYHGHRLFHCAPARGVFVSADQCAADTRFDDPAEHHAAGWTVEDMTGAAGGVKNTDEVRKQFGNVECPMVEGCIAPMSEYRVCTPFIERFISTREM